MSSPLARAAGVVRQPSAPPDTAALYRGIVVEAFANGTVSVVAAKLAGTDALGPMPSVPDGLTVGELVLIAAVGGTTEDLVVAQRFGPEPAPLTIDGGNVQGT